MADLGLPAGWDRRYSKRRGGRAYHFDRVTQRSQWARPLTPIVTDTVQRELPCHTPTSAIATLPDELLLWIFELVATRGSDSIGLASVSSRWRAICQQQLVVKLDLSAPAGAPAVWLPGEVLIVLREPPPTHTSHPPASTTIIYLFFSVVHFDLNRCMAAAGHRFRSIAAISLRNRSVGSTPYLPTRVDGGPGTPASHVAAALALSAAASVDLSGGAATNGWCTALADHASDVRHLDLADGSRISGVGLLAVAGCGNFDILTMSHSLHAPTGAPHGVPCHGPCSTSCPRLL